MFHTARWLSGKIPWGSLVLLLFAYVTLGKALLASSYPKLAWCLAIGWVFFLATFLTLPRFNIERVLAGWLKSDAVTFSVLMLLAALISVAVVWTQVSVQILLIFSTEALARIDLRRVGFSVMQSFWFLTITSLTGLGLGWSISQQIGFHLSLAPRFL